MADVLQVRTVHGVEVVEFKPTPQMRLFAMALFCDPSLSGKEPEAICDSIGISHHAFKTFKSYEPHYSEWMEDFRLSLGGKNKRSALEAVGMQRALAGEFNFWKPLALREGVIEPDRLEMGISIPANLGAYRGMDDNKLKALENSVMESLRADDNSGTVDFSQSPDGWERESDSGGTSEVPLPVVLAPELGVDGESPLDGLESF